ncbi:hypothetical protein K469DRAFT_714905 [Zopfia rhizophila CBS 207.26]|uniref:Uncharacterized protein n=1 Tax=Zopfia rhizophila CBS 207.26 TaxID=1314779 RepID=A0A6A6ENW6_9PEZI|nr:hypothetical protein K469DRAFT_714905 [Zopfia rhizophila CBS 207.26]
MDSYLGKGGTLLTSAIEKFVKRVLNRDPELDPRSLVLNLLLQHADDPPPHGREERFPEYGEVANEVVRLATMDEMPCQAIIRIAEQNTGQRIPYSTGHGIFKKREIVKRAPPRKI